MQKGDVIYRRQAIDAMNELPKWSDATSAVCLDYSDVISVLSDTEKLSSAQPEIIRCKDCKYGSPNGKYGCKCYHYTLYETHEMKPEDFCSRAERRRDE